MNLNCLVVDSELETEDLFEMSWEILKFALSVLNYLANAGKG
jgi:hypothetical protein